MDAFFKFKEIKELRIGVQTYAAQTIPQIEVPLKAG
jgi:hypothetical protein